MSRPDLLALTPEALASLANLGLVKRAQRELEAGTGPSLEELDDGTVVGTFGEGVVARLPRSTPLKEAPCSCGAANVCRHRVAVALAYVPFHRARVAEPVRADGSALSPSWSPAELDDATLERALGPKMLERARASLRKGLLATVELDAVPTAKLPSCTVRFLVPHDVAYARCDCALAGGGCEHLALAVWAFRAAPRAVASAVVALGGADEKASRGEVLEEAVALAQATLRTGIAASTLEGARFAHLRAGLAREGMTWMHELVVDLEMALEGYHARSARFGTREIAQLLGELAARARAGQRDDGELPRRFVLGEGEAPETRLDHVRLVSLGARLSADGPTRFADVYLADPSAALVLVLRKRWDYDAKAEPDDGAALGRKLVAPGIRLEALARGQVVSKVLDRKANRSVTLGSSRAAQTSVTPQRGDFGALPAPLLVRDLLEHREWLTKRPPRLLRPRVLAEEVHVVEVGDVRDVRWSAAEQRLVARLCDAAGHPFDLVVQHRRAAPYAIETVAAALASEVRFVAGELRLRDAGWSLEPLSIANDALVIPDLGLPAPTLVGSGPHYERPEAPIEVALASVEAALEELCHVGLSSPSRAVLARALAVAHRLEEVGLVELAARLHALEAQARSGSADAPRAWIDAALRLALVREANGH